MSESFINPTPQQSRLVQALINVARSVAEDVVRRAQLTQTPVILADEYGHILSLDPEDLAEQLKKSTNELKIPPDSNFGSH